MTIKNTYPVLVIFCISLFLTAFAQAELRLAGIFGDNMVLQRGMENPIWGWAEASTTITVEAKGQKLSATAGADGKWMVRLPSMDLGEPFSIKVSNVGKNDAFVQAIEVKNVVVGEVWICSGQSNMEWTVNGSGNPEEERANANYPMIRHIKVQHTISMAPNEDCKTTGWQICTPETAGNFTAVGYYFGRRLHTELDVPVGLINTTWGGTIVEAWTSGSSLESHPDFTKRIQLINDSAGMMDKAAKKFESDMKDWQQKYNDAMAKADRESVGDIDDSNWGKITAPGPWEQQGHRGYDGVAWYRKTVELPERMVGKELQLSLAMIDDNDRTFVNGKMVGRTNGWRTPRRYKVPSDINNKVKLSVAVQVVDNSGGGGIHGAANQMQISAAGMDPVSIAGDWRFKKSDLMVNLPPRPVNPGFNGPNNPTALFNGMVNPLLPVAFKGTIWYQGESNAGRAHQYRTLFPLLIKDWRKQWNREFPFYWVQLANFMQASSEPSGSTWAELREAQSMTLSLSQTGEAVIIDIGEARDIHPKNKQDVGKRLAGIALKHDYGLEVDYSGPRYKAMKVEGNKIRLGFDYAAGLKTSDGKRPARFEIAGADKKFVWATAMIEGQEVVVTSPDVKDPVAVRYAWANNPVGCNLTNRGGLPASPFRTDDWPGVTVGAK